ncbi:hypothetical protein DYBT9275_02767 [Dyadobacter sp. CECT 9275]|uniref:Phage minor structural protein GP20 n=1 Tax=Dyadobacter helix TaxID=2822344 RepID=A0A916NC21_9BACT|nr:hypothetical protein [Dyadobacter sp. CECT 9275]CAG5001918.1 hypothetical protein DYBT9275_02767 [Dyadobacter sp. CECT 9275]
MEIEQLLKIISQILGIPVAQAKELIEAEDGEKAVADLSKENLKKKFDAGHKKGMGQSAETLAKAISDELEIDVNGSTPADIASSLKTAFETRSAEGISEETVKGTEAYKALQADLTRAQQEQNKLVEKKVKEALKEKEADYQKNLKAAKREALNTELTARAEKWLTDNNAILHKDPEKRRLQIKELVDKLGSFEIERDGETFLISKDGQPLTDQSGHNAGLDQVFKDYDHLFHFQEVQQRQSSGLPAGGIQSGGQSKFTHFKGKVPENQDEMNKINLEYAEKKISREAYQEVKAAFAEQPTK